MKSKTARVRLALALLLVPLSAMWQAYGLSLSGSKLGLVEYSAVTVVTVLALLVCALAVFFLARRWTLLPAAAAVLLAINFAVSGEYAAYRVRFTKTMIERTYDRLAERVGDLPPAPEGQAFEGWGDERTISHGYWRSGDGKRFEVFYHYGSDSYVLRYPEKKWRYEGNNYCGPVGP